MEDDLSVTSDEFIFIKICVPELSVEKCLQFSRSDLVWDVKQQCLRSLPKVRGHHTARRPPHTGRPESDPVHVADRKRI